MAYLVLALGALLSVGGGLSIFYGAGIVEVERGWTGVIAGATSLTGGILTIALGLILRTLLEMRVTTGVAAAGVDRVSEPVSSALPEPAPAIPAPVAVAEADLEGDLLAAFLSPHPDGTAASTTTSPPMRAETSESVAPAPLREEVVPEPPAPVDELAEPARARSRLRVGFKSPAAEAAAPPEASADQATLPAMDDWLDRAFSSLDSELGAGIEEPHRENAAPQPTQDEAHPETYPRAFAGHGVAEIERISSHEINPPEAGPQELVTREATPAHPPVSAPTPHPAAAAPPSQSAIIGRYEADGTSYVMFADGSIEAQSEAGVYRFSSMTELKAYIEGTG